ncbi:hypothetical protein RR46_11830 [Papilio xuthus]|uniref:MICOS complex subunit MIC19 n=1 Tax=Papilio xuthus TaxID=66420 RepID=A0A194PN18_PAPXU|nr:hypothetical protein RR46_11830 [Papilio xuthus]
MGILITKDTRRISFVNTIEINPAILVEKSIEDQNTFVQNNLETECADELIFDETIPFKEIQDEEQKYWSGRIESLKNEHQVITKIIETEYEKTIENTNKLYEEPIITEEKIEKVKPCYNWRTKMLQCYESNPHQPLVCSPVVKAFNDYIETCRISE